MYPKLFVIIWVTLKHIKIQYMPLQLSDSVENKRLLYHRVLNLAVAMRQTLLSFSGI